MRFGLGALSGDDEVVKRQDRKDGHRRRRSECKKQLLERRQAAGDFL